MKCPKCNSVNLDAIYNENFFRRKSIFTYILFNFLTLGIWLIFYSYYRKNYSYKIYYICKDCGFKFNKKDFKKSIDN